MDDPAVLRCAGPRDDRWTSDRDYFYRETNSGRTTQFISDLKHCAVDRFGRGPVVEKIDIASGRCLARYQWDERGQQWRDCR